MDKTVPITQLHVFLAVKAAAVLFLRENVLIHRHLLVFSIV